MKQMNETAAALPLAKLMGSDEGWGRIDGREVYPKLIQFIESNPGVSVFRVSFKGVRRVDMSFASETVVELASRYRTQKGICLVDLTNEDMIENIDAAARRKGIPLVVWMDKHSRIIGLTPSAGTEAAMKFAMARNQFRAAEFAAAQPEVSIANASTKFRQLWELGFLLRREEAAESGGKEFTYFRIG